LEGEKIMYYTDDPIADFDRYDREQAQYEARLPRCANCGEPIHEKYYYIEGDIICEECLESNYAHDVEID
jgi:formylmethanofuran dehydrogenase subunit E